MAESIDIANAIAVWLNSNIAGIGGVAAFRERAEFKLAEKATDLFVSVILESIPRLVKETRGTMEKVMRFDIDVQKRFEDDDLSTVYEECMDILEEVAEKILGQTIGVGIVSGEADLIILHEQLKTLGQFSGVLQIRVRRLGKVA